MLDIEWKTKQIIQRNDEDKQLSNKAKKNIPAPETIVAC